MNKAIAIFLRDKLAAPYLDRTSGLVQVFEKVTEGENGLAIAKRIPVTSSASWQECNTKLPLQEMVPNSAYKGMLYFEDGGIALRNAARGVEYTSRLRAVVWLNTKLIKNAPDSAIAAQIQAEMISRINSIVYQNSGVFTRIVAKVVNIPVADKNIFSKYDYEEKTVQYLMSPFDFFALDVQVDFTIPDACLKPIEVTTTKPLC